MAPRTRVLNAIARQGYDRIPAWYQATPEFERKMEAALGVASLETVNERLGVDLRFVTADWCGPKRRTFEDGSWEGAYGERYKMIPYEGGAFPEAVHLPFAEANSLSDLKSHRFPAPDDYDYSTIARQCRQAEPYARVFGHAGILDCMNGIARSRGVQRVYMDVGQQHPVFLELVERRFACDLGRARRALEAAAGDIEIVYCGEDLGQQLGPVISPRTFDRLFADKYAQFFELAHRYGAKAMMHSCGGVRPFIPRLIELGLDILDVVQVGAADMDIDELAAEFGERICFSGSMCVQTILPTLSETQVRAEVRRRLRLFPDGGLLLAPSHSIQVGTPVKNVIAMYEEAGAMSA